jgi:hypothetical protein
MPAVSKAQERFLWAEYGRAKAHKSRQTKMSISQLEEYIHTPQKNLPERVGKNKSKAKSR